MRKVGVGLSAGILTAVCFWAAVNAKAEGNTVAQKGNQVLHDEGYGNDDEEYYNSENEVINDQEASDPQENSLNGSIVNDAQ